MSVEIEGFQMLTELGNGEGYRLWIGCHKRTSSPVLIRVVQKEIENKTQLIREINLYKQLDSPFIGQLFHVVDTQTEIYFIQEFYDMNVFDLVKSTTVLNEEKARRLFLQMVTALEILHSKNLVLFSTMSRHSVLVNKQCKLGLFNFQLTPPDDKMGSLSLFSPPETLRFHPSHSKSSDIWVAGIVLYYMITGEYPFEETEKLSLSQSILQSQLKFPLGTPDQVMDLLQKMLQKTPESRITFNEIKSHPWCNYQEQSQFVLDKIKGEFLSTHEGMQEEIKQRIVSYGFDSTMLSQMLMCNEYSELTAIYKLMLREKLNERVPSIYAEYNPQNGNTKKSRPSDMRPRTCSHVVANYHRYQRNRTEQTPKESPVSTKKFPPY